MEAVCCGKHEGYSPDFEIPGASTGQVPAVKQLNADHWRVPLI